jgi:hypothetical protein
MHERCSHCNTKYKIEPSFFYGAMYVSYGLGVAMGVATFVIAAYLFKLERLTIFFIIMAVMIGTLPVVIRLSRNIWINMFMDYDPTKAKKS